MTTIPIPAFSPFSAFRRLLNICRPFQALPVADRSHAVFLSGRAPRADSSCRWTYRSDAERPGRLLWQTLTEVLYSPRMRGQNIFFLFLINHKE
ncbi:hypothetical protein [uncultured Alistipes sp.]|jgi:hypothetical protein|uniref:hypothetical protein n=1 Tax=uncultured Alistipes sp. TaxID=538949 RepID=UPI002629AB90|nr:hypothetical protein [uncultured Alistipes sp.]